MHTEQMLRPERILRRQDFGKCEVTLAIAGVSREAVGTGCADIAWFLHFDETEQVLLLHPRLIEALQADFGSDTDLWIGQRVVLWSEAQRIELREARARPRDPPSGPCATNVIDFAHYARLRERDRR